MSDDDEDATGVHGRVQELGGGAAGGRRAAADAGCSRAGHSALVDDAQLTGEGASRPSAVAVGPSRDRT